jgi:hypothetical protein
MVLHAGTETQGNITGNRVSLRQNTTKSMHLLKEEKIFLRHKATFCQPVQELHKDQRREARQTVSLLYFSLSGNESLKLDATLFAPCNYLLFRGINSAKQKR